MWVRVVAQNQKTKTVPILQMPQMGKDKRGGKAMGRVSQETLDRLNAFIASLPSEAKKKCSLCNETLTHIVKQAEAQTGAGTRTVCRALADSHNEGAAPADVVSGDQLQDRVRQKEGLKMGIPHNSTTPKPLPSRTDSFSMRYVEIAISQLERIKDDDSEAESALLFILKWISDRLEKMPMKKRK